MIRNSFSKRLLSFYFVGIVLFGSLSVLSFPVSTRAQTIPGVPSVVFDPWVTIQSTISAVANGTTAAVSTAAQTKGYTLDPLAWAVAKAALQAIVKSTVNWVNNGFNGSPAYVTNLDTTLLSVSNASADSFLRQLATNGAIRSPFQNQIANAVGNNYNTNTNGGFFAANPFTLGQVSSDPAAFLRGGSGFEDGGWDAWLSASMNPQNNPYGATILANNALNGQVAQAVATQQTQLNWAKGFLSWKGSCGATGSASSGAAPGSICKSDNDCAGTLACISGRCSIDPTLDATSLSTSDKCLAYNIQTPGTVIESQLEKALGSGVDTLVSAHTFDEMINATLAQLMNQVVGSTGLFGLSQPSATTGNTAYFNQTDTTQAGINTSLSSNFSATLATELSGVQAYQSEWNTINTAAQAARTALAASSCSSAQSTITNMVQPVIDQATAAISKAASLISSIQSIQSSLAQSTPANATAVLSNASTANSTVTSNLPSPSEDSYAQAQSVSGTNANGTPTLLSQMNQIAQQAQACVAAH